MYEETKHELDKNFIDVKGLKRGKLYEFIVVVVDGYAIRESDIVEIETLSYVAGKLFFNFVFIKLLKHLIIIYFSSLITSVTQKSITTFSTSIANQYI